MRTLGIATLSMAVLLWTGMARAMEIIVSAASSLTNAMTDIGRDYERVHPGQKVVFNFSGSGALVQQIARGAPVDVFASADQVTMDRAAQQNLIVAATRTNFARNALVVIAARAMQAPPKALADLANPGISRLAISNPDSVPVGRYSKEALEAAGLWDAIREKSLNTQNVRQSLDYVARGEAQAGFVYRTDAAVMPDKVDIRFEVPTRTPILYPIAAVKGNGKEKAAMKFIEFVRSGAGQKILARYGFQSP